MPTETGCSAMKNASSLRLFVVAVVVVVAVHFEFQTQKNEIYSNEAGALAVEKIKSSERVVSGILCVCVGCFVVDGQQQLPTPNNVTATIFVIPVYAPSYEPLRAQLIHLSK